VNENRSKYKTNGWPVRSEASAVALFLYHFLT